MNPVAKDNSLPTGHVYEQRPGLEGALTAYLPKEIAIVYGLEHYDNVVSIIL